MNGPGPGTLVYGILGWPVRHSRSPAMLNAAFRAAGIDAVYAAFPVPPGRLARAIGGLAALGIRGANVTMPHKEEAARLVDEVEDRGVGAVNTLSVEEGRVIGRNTDVDAFRGFLTEDAGVDVRGRAVLLLGAGGAARACAVALGEAEVGRLVVAARRPAAARAVADLAAGAGEKAVVPFEEAGPASDEADVLVNTTSLGWEGEALPLRPRRGHVAVDLVYRATPFLEAARSAGAEARDGLGMLVRQAGLSFRIWTGMDPPARTMEAAASAVDPCSG